MKHNKGKTAIVILNYNGIRFLEKFIPSVVRHSSNEECFIVVADNASTDNSVPFLENNYPNIQIIQLSENHGFAQGYNLALDQVNAEYFVLLNSDVEVTDNWLSPIIDYMDSHPTVAACQPKIMSFSDKAKFEYAGASGGFIDKYGYPFCRGRIFNKLEEDNKQYDHVEEIFWASGACFFIRRKDFFEAGGFDADFFAHMEEIDLCWRLRNMDREIVCIPQSIVYHVGGGTLSVENPHKTFLNFRNNLLMLYKNLPEDKLKRTLFIRKMLDGIAAIQFLLSGKIKNAKKIWRAHQEFEKMKPLFEKKRAANQQKNPTLLKGFYNKSIVVAFYLKGKKKFNELRIE